jgi:uncharacterized membrane protein YhaH (DUF805 family)
MMSQPSEPQPTYGAYPPVGHVAAATPSVSFGDAVRTCFSRYVDFSGRARRSEYWYFALCEVLVIIAAAVVDAVIGNSSGVLTALALLAFLLPSLAVTVRRLHDTDRSGWWYLLSFIPFGGLVLLVFVCQDSTPGPNQWGPSPKTGAWA